MFEVGRLIARIQLEGTATFGRDLAVVGSQFSKLDDKGRQASANVGKYLLGIGAGILAVAGYAIKMSADYQAALSGVQAVTGATADQLDKLGNAAIENGRKFGFSATEAIDGEESLAKAGVSLADIMGGALSGALTLAAAGQIKVGDAADIASIAMTQFGLSGKDVPHIADLIAAGAGKAVGDVGDLSLALKQSGLVASQFGLSLEDTVGTLAAFASQGLLGSDAGTSFKQMLLSLAAPSQQATALLKKYNIEAYDQQGNFIGITKLAGTLQKNLGGLSAAERQHALSVIFGSDAIRSANVLLTQGSKGIKQWINDTNDQGYAANQAQKRLDNLNGDVKKLTASFNAGFIKAGSGVNDVLREIVQSVTQVVDWFDKLPAPVQGAAVELGIMLGIVLLLGGAFLLAVPKVLEFRVALATLSKQLPAVGAGLGKVSSILGGPWAIGIAAAALGVQALQAYLESLQSTSAQYQNSLKTSTTATQIFKTALKGKDVTFIRDVSGDFKDLNKVLDTSADQAANWWKRIGNDTNFAPEQALRDIGTQLKTLASSDLPAAQHAFSLLAKETDGSQKHLWELLSDMPDYRDALIAEAAQQGINVTSTDEHANKVALLKLAQEDTTKSTKDETSAYDQAEAAISGTTTSINDLAKAYDDLNKPGQDAAEATLNYAQSLGDFNSRLAEITAGTKGYAKGVDLATQAGRDNYKALLDLAQAGKDVADANLAAGGSTEAYKAQLDASKATWLAQAAAIGMNADQAKALADKIYAIPTQKQIDLIVNTAAAQQNLNNFVTNASGRKIQIPIILTPSGVKQFKQSQYYQLDQHEGGRVHYYAQGGFENHTAQIARAGTTRVWNEPETEGELYAPLAASKRGRTMQILGQQLDEWGYSIVPKGAKGTAQSASSTGARGPVKITGTLDLGNGLTGIVTGIVEGVLDDAATEINGGSNL